MNKGCDSARQKGNKEIRRVQDNKGSEARR